MNCKQRFLEYVSFPTMSDESSESVPSTDKQFALAEYIAAELKAADIDVCVDDKCYVYASIPSNCKKDVPTIGLIAHLDTSDECHDSPIVPKTVSYTGGDIVLNSENSIVLRLSDYPDLAKYEGQDIIVTDGTTLLGADDKAGIAAIVTAAINIVASGRPHGCIKIAFTPDEEIGRGADNFDIGRFGADYAYTVDGGALGEIEFENFNAAAAAVDIKGVSIHPGSAKGKMKNAALIAMEFNSLLPCGEIPSMTEGYEGFHHLTQINARVEKAHAEYIIRDHDRKKFEAKKKNFTDAAEIINKKYGDGTIILTLRDSYYNMKEIIEKHMYTVERAEKAMRAAGVEPNIIPIRGGTDGARLSFMGLPCPNICTGGENFHSRFEYLPAESLEKVTQIVENLITDIAEQ